MQQIEAVKFLEENKYFLFPNNLYTDKQVEEALLSVSDFYEMSIRSVKFKDPGTLQIISVIPGSLGVDRFYLGEIALGALKYISFAGFGVWWIADILSAKNRCRTYNCKKLMETVSSVSNSVLNKKSNIDLNSVVNTEKEAESIVNDALKSLTDTMNL